MDFCVYEMRRDTKGIPSVEVCCIPFRKQYLEQYVSMYNAAFRPMREELDIKPYDWYHDGNMIPEKESDIYIFAEGEELIGSVACYGNEIDDLFVGDSYRGKGYGRQLLIWAMDHIASAGYVEMVIHVAEWNQNAVKMYLDEGFKVVKKETIVSR